MEVKTKKTSILRYLAIIVPLVISLTIAVVVSIKGSALVGVLFFLVFLTSFNWIVDSLRLLKQINQ